MKELSINFTYAKPVNLVKYLITIANKANDITVLDCFAGSGTTAHAVLSLNKEDGGRRRFILCTNNENNICERITYERLKKVISGYSGTKKNKIAGIPTNLKYYKTSYIPKLSKSDENYCVADELLKHIKEMVQLENGVALDGINYILVLSDDEADEIENNPEKILFCTPQRI